MFQFSCHTLKVGGKVLIPDSEISKIDYGVIESVNTVGIFVRYFKGSNKSQLAFYRFRWLQEMYGPKPSKPDTGYTSLCGKCNRFTRFCQCEEELDQELPTSLQ